MLWSDLLARVSDDLGEATTDLDYLHATYIKTSGALAQTQASKAIQCLEYDWSYLGNQVAITAGNPYVTLPLDLIYLRRVMYETDTFLYPCDGRPDIETLSTGDPYRYWLVGKNKLGIEPYTTSAGKYLYLFGTRATPPYAFQIKEYNTDSTAATVAISATTLTVTITGGAKAGAYTIDLTAAAYDTIGKVTARFATIGAGTTTINVSGLGTWNANQPSTDLEIIAATDIKGVTKDIFLNPELPDDMLIDIVVEKMMARQCLKDRDKAAFQMHETLADAAIERYKNDWARKATASGNRVRKPMQQNAMLGDTGWNLAGGRLHW